MNAVQAIDALLAVLHAYIGLRLLPLLPLPAIALGVLALLALYGLVDSALPTGRRRVHDGALMWAGYIAMGLFSSLFVLTLLRDLALLALSLWSWARHDPLPWARFAYASAWAVPLLAALATAIGFVFARRTPPVKRVRVPLSGLPTALHGFTIVQISDLHVGPTIRRDFVERVVARANGLGADLAVLTGDLVDGSVEALREHIAPLGRLQARHGVYGVTGNHEYYAGVQPWLAELRRLGLRMLNNEHVVLAHGGASLLLAGVPDYGAHQFDPAHRSDPARALAGADAALRPRLLLAHQPRSAPAAAEAGFDLQLSGHTHGGQFLPWRWFVPLQQPLVDGLRRYEGMWVYVSRGTGYWGPPKRLGASSEITLLTLQRAG